MQPRENAECYASSKQRALLLKIVQIELIQKSFFLTGGTALSVFYLGHRISEDLDFFTTQPINLKEIAHILKRIISPQQTISEHDTFLSYVSPGGKIDFVVDPLSYQIDRPQVKLSFQNKKVAVTIDTLDNICINKICAVVSRLSAKDAVDLFFLFKDVYNTAKFFSLYEEARKREALLDDFNYAIEVYLEIQKKAKDILKTMAPSLKKGISLNDFKALWQQFANILKSNLESSLNQHSQPTPY